MADFVQTRITQNTLKEILAVFRQELSLLLGDKLEAIYLYGSQARESLHAARLLIQENLPNIAASRGYYAMFYIAEALLLTRDQVFSSHSAVISAYGKEFARSLALDPKFHRYLIASQNTRHIGDYGVEENVSREDAEEVILWAQEFLEAAEVYLHKNTYDA